MPEERLGGKHCRETWKSSSQEDAVTAPKPKWPLFLRGAGCSHSHRTGEGKTLLLGDTACPTLRRPHASPCTGTFQRKQTQRPSLRVEQSQEHQFLDQGRGCPPHCPGHQLVLPPHGELIGVPCLQPARWSAHRTSFHVQRSSSETEKHTHNIP